MLACARTPPGPPNLLLVSMDCVRADHLSLHGWSRPTSPWLDRLAAHGAVFDAAFSQANESAFSHAALFSGRYASELAVPDYTRFAVPAEATLLGDVLHAYGYQTAAFLAGGHISSDFGFDHGWDHFSEERGFGSFWHTTPKALQWLDEHGAEKPWLVVLHGYDAHRNWTLPGPLYHQFTGGYAGNAAEEIVRHGEQSEKVFGGRYFPQWDLRTTRHRSGVSLIDTRNYDLLAGADGASLRLSRADVDHIQAHYDGQIAYADLQLALFFAAAERAGHLDNTLVVVTADHGEGLLDDGYLNHRATLHDANVHVPLVLVGPGVPAGVRVQDLVEALDVAPTLLAAAGAVPPAGLRGRNLLDRVAGRAFEPRDTLFLEGARHMIAARSESWKLVFQGLPLTDPDYVRKLAAAEVAAPDFQLWDLRQDPAEQRELLATGEGMAVARAMREQLVAWRASLTTGTHAVEAIDPALEQSMREHGYF